MTTIEKLASAPSLFSSPRTVYQPSYPLGIDLTNAMDSDFTLPQDVALFYAVVVSDPTTINHVVCYTRNIPSWSVQPQTDTTVFNGFCIYRKVSNDSLEFMGHTTNSDSFLCNNVEKEIWKHTVDLQASVELLPGIYYVSISTKIGSDVHLSHLDDVAYSVSVREGLLDQNETFGSPLIYRYKKPLFLVPPSAITVSEDLDVVETNDEGHACLLYIQLE